MCAEAVKYVLKFSNRWKKNKAKTWMIIGKKHLHVCWGGKTWAQTLHQVGWRRWCGHSQSETSAHTGEIWHPRVPQTCSCHLRNNNMKHYWHHLPTHINDSQNSLHFLAAGMTDGICLSVCVCGHKGLGHKGLSIFWHNTNIPGCTALLQNVSDNTQINSVLYLPGWRQILNTFTDLFQCTWANLHIYSLSPWTNLQIHYLSLSEKNQTDSRPVLSKRTLSFSPSRSSGMPDRKTRIFTLPTISLRRTLPFALTCTYICINFKNSNKQNSFKCSCI